MGFHVALGLAVYGPHYIDRIWNCPMHSKCQMPHVLSAQGGRDPTPSTAFLYSFTFGVIV